jgi:hypothetical protein
LGVLFVFSPVVGARSFSLDRVAIIARVDPDGSLWIDETRTYTYDGRYSWAEFRLPLDRVGSVSDFSLLEADRAFTASTSETPGTYELTSSADELYVRWHYVAEDETRSFTLRYRIGDVVARHPDVAELYYQFVGAINPQSIGRVEVEVALPEPAVFGDVRAWAHGPLHGQVAFEASGRLAFDVAPLPARQMWEARAVFPVGWLTVGAAAVTGDPALDRILVEEDAWVREANDRRERDRVAILASEASGRTAGRLSTAMAVFGLLAVVMGYLKAGRGHVVAYTQRVDANIPTEPPALASYVYYTKQVQGGALGATLFDLARRSLLNIEQDPQKKKWYESGPKFTIRLQRNEWRRRKSELKTYERSLIEFLFDEVAEGRDALGSRELKKARGKMQKWFRGWKKLVQASAPDRPFYDPASMRAAIGSALVAAAIVVTGIVLVVRVGPPGVVAIIAGFVCLLSSLAILRMTPEAKLQRKKLQAFRRYLKDYHQQSRVGVGERIGEYLVYGLALGVDAKVIERLFGSLSKDDRATYLPWYVQHHGTASPAEFAHAMTAVVTATTAVVNSSAGAG